MAHAYGPDWLRLCFSLHSAVQVAGQIWIPAVTVFIGAFTIAAVGIFQNSIALGFSYGVCVSTLVSHQPSAG